MELDRSIHDTLKGICTILGDNSKVVVKEHKLLLDHVFLPTQLQEVAVVGFMHLVEVRINIYLKG
jgi:hypothetical protein